MLIKSIIDEINSKKNILILGYGREGKSTYKLIRRYLKDKKLTIADSNENLILNNPELKEDKNTNIVLGKNYLNNLSDYDMIIKSPGINFKYVDYSNIIERITSQIDLFLKYANCKTIGITGTKGKSTTSSLVFHILKNLEKDVLLAGNIGIPIFDDLDMIKDDTIVVLELSCHQLQFINSAPNISVILNIYEDHLDLYKSYNDYQLAKLNIFSKQNKSGYKILGMDSIDSKKWYKKEDNIYTISTDIKNVKNGILIEKDGLYIVSENNKSKIYDNRNERKLIGDHNLYNIAAALLVCNALKIDLNIATKYIGTFEPLEHRMEKVGTYRGITFYNDSIATIPSATINCINSIKDLSTIIVGGLDRGVNLNELTNYLFKSSKIKTCIFLKDTGYKIYDDLKKLGCDKNMYKALDMEDAVKYAYKNTPINHSCALSPSAASYNVYKNFQERGKDYKRLIIELSKKDF